MAGSGGTVGFDFGTSTTLVAQSDGPHRVSVVPIGVTTPWIETVAGLSDGGWVFGDQAELLSDRQVVRSVKSFITRGEAPFLGDRRLDSGQVDLLIEGIFAHCRQAALTRDGLDLGALEVRLGCPALWLGHQRQTLADAAQRAGVNADVDNMIDEPIAAGVDWIWEGVVSETEPRVGRLLVVDIGGGTTDVALMQIEFDGRRPEIKVLACRGADLAGDEVDAELADRIVELMTEMSPQAVDRDDPVLTTYLRRAARLAKVRLTDQPSTTVRLPAPYEHIPAVEVTRALLDQALAGPMQQILRTVILTLREAHLRDKRATVAKLRNLPEEQLLADVAHVLVTGGMSRTPAVQEVFREKFHNAQVHIAADDLATTRIVRGFARDDVYSSLNLNRPGMDIVLQWRNSSGNTEERVLFEAFSPLFDWWQGLQDQTTYQHVESRLPVSGTVTGRVSIRSVGGAEVRLRTSAGEDLDLPVRLNGLRDFVLRLTAAGDLTLTDCDGRKTPLRVPEWPYARFAALRSLDAYVDIEAGETDVARLRRLGDAEAWRQ